MFKKLVKLLLAAENENDIENALYGENGVDILFQKEKIKWDEHEILFSLADKISKGFN